MTIKNQQVTRPRLFGMITTAASISYTKEALDTFFRYTDFQYNDRFILIDNDGAWLQNKLFDLPKIEILSNPNPLGFAANSNQLMRIALENLQNLYILNNDLIFTNNWHLPMDASGASITCPLSNREVQYTFAIQVSKVDKAARVFSSPLQMNLDDYQGYQFAVQAIAEAHQQNSAAAFMPVLVMPYFCVRIPFEIIKAVGFFDEEFGRGGGEDYDYSLRAHLMGYPTQYVLNSWLIHFYGKSSWSGVEDQAQRLEREQQILNHFEKKWGSTLKEVIFKENTNLILEKGLKLPSSQGDYIELIQKLKA